MKCYKSQAGIKVLDVEYSFFRMFKIRSKNELFSTEKEIEEYFSTITQQPLSGSPNGSPKSCATCSRGFLIFCLKAAKCDKYYSQWASRNMTSKYSK